MNSFLSKLEDRILDGIQWILAPFTEEKTDDNSVCLYLFGLEGIIIAALIGAGTAAVISRKKRKAQQSMAKKQMAQQKREAKAMKEAEESSRTPREPKNQQLSIQGTPKKAKKSGPLAIRGRGGKGSLRVGGTGNYGARVT